MLHLAQATIHHLPCNPPRLLNDLPACRRQSTEAEAPPTAHLSSPQACPTSSSGPGVRVLCVELVGNRFLRRMVRVLVATAMRESIPAAARYPGADDSLLRIAEERDRLASAPAAPGEGLCFCEAACTM